MTETTKMIKAIANDSKVRIDRIVANYEQLEKENAELKEELKEYKNGNFVQTVNQIIEGKDKQLTKAKEIIHKVCYEYGIYDKDLMEEAKQFLKECK